MHNFGDYIELSELQNIISERVEGLEVWIKVEIESHRVVKGHHYINLIEKKEGGLIAARASAHIWASNSQILSDFEWVCGKSLEAGMTVVMKVEVDYHPVYGLALEILELDSNFTLGQRELEKQKTIAELEKSGAMERQKRLALSYLPGKIAVISSSDAAGYGDFSRHLASNPFGYAFDYVLFQSLMQGEKAPASIMSSLEQIRSQGGFDMVLILRGGGAESDLYCYDDKALCQAIADFPLPILTAVGHERDYHVCDMVAKDYYKTPTAAANALIDWVQQVEGELQRLALGISFALKSKLALMEKQLSLLEMGIKAADPRRILEQGYLLAVGSDGKLLKKAGQGAAGDVFTLKFGDGDWHCEIDKILLKDE